jgi:competence protein ComEC
VLIKEVPFLRIGLPLCLGIISGLYFKPDINFLLSSFIILIPLFSYSIFFNRYQTNRIYGPAIFISFFIAGTLLYHNEKSSLSNLNHEKAVYECTLSDYPETRENSIRLTMKLNCRITDNKFKTLKGGILIYCKPDVSIGSLVPGDILIIRCIPAEISNRGNPNEFNYRFFMENQGIRYTSFIESRDIIKYIKPLHRKIIYRALIVREKIISMFRERGINGERLALVSAITLGQKNMLDPEQKLNFIKAGVMHIMAVSGLHAIILSLFIFNVLFFMKGKLNILRVIITILILWAFAFVTGLTPSVLRATLMYSFLQAGKLMERPVNSLNMVLASAFILVILRPSVIFDAGFLLSYSAVIYIITFYQGFYLILHFKNWLSDKIWQSAAVTLVAQAGTLPLTISLFNRFPTYFMAANITIVPLSNLLIINGCLVPLFFHIRFLSHILAMILNYLTGLTEQLTASAAALPYSTIENIGMTTSESILLSFTIFLFCYWLINRRAFAVFYPLLFLALFSIDVIKEDLSSKNRNELIIYNTPGSSTIGIKTGKVINLISDTTVVRQEVIRHAATLGIKIHLMKQNKAFVCFEAGKQKILITQLLNDNIIKLYKPAIVILTGKKPLIENNPPLSPHLQSLIITSEPSSGFSLPRNIDLSGTDSVHFVRRSGAYTERL